MERKKILLITSGFPFGDTERGFLTTEFRHLTEHFDVSILSIGSKEPILYPISDSVPVERYAYPSFFASPKSVVCLLRNFLSLQVLREVLEAAKGERLQQVLRRAKQIVAYRAKAQAIAERIESHILKGKAELVYTYWCTEATLAGALLKKKYPQVQVITRFHGHDLFQTRKKDGWQPFRKLIAAHIDRLVFACCMGREYFLNTWGREFAWKAQVHYLGCAPGTMPPKMHSQTLRVVSCSNLIPLKRVDYIIEGLHLVSTSVKVQWDHFGDGTERQRLEKLAAEKLGENVSWCFHGRVPQHELAERYYKIDPDIFLTTSSTEGGVPVSLQEAFAMGIPAIGTAVGGIPELILHGETGWLLPADLRGQDVADGIMEFLQMPAEKRATMQKNVLTLWRELFDAEHNACVFIEELKSLILNRE